MNFNFFYNFFISVEVNKRVKNNKKFSLKANFYLIKIFIYLICQITPPKKKLKNHSVNLKMVNFIRV